MSQYNRQQQYGTPQYRESYTDDNPFKSTQGYIKEERQYNINSARKTRDSSNNNPNYSMNNTMNTNSRLPNEYDSAKKTVSTYVSTRNTRAPMSVNNPNPIYEQDESIQMTNPYGSVNDTRYYSTQDRGSYVPSYVGNQNNTTGRSSYVTSRTSYVDDFNNDVSREKKVGYRELRAKDVMIDKLKSENEKLLKDVHKYKKIEAGLSFGSGNKKLVENSELKTQNANLIEEVVRMKTIINELETRGSNRALDQENNRLKNVISQMEQEKSGMISEIERVKNTSTIIRENNQSSMNRENPKMREQLENERRKYDDLRSEMARVTSDNQILRAQIERGRGNDMKIASFDNQIGKMHETISSLQSENRQLVDQINSVKLKSQMEFQEHGRNLESDREMNAQLKEDFMAIESRLRKEMDKNRSLCDELDGMKSKIVQLEVKNEFNQKKVCPYHGDDDFRKTEEDRIFSMFKSKLDEKTKEVANLYGEIDTLKNQNQELRTKLSGLEVHFETSSTSQNRKDKDIISLYKLNLDEMKMQVDFLNKENAKLKELLKTVDNKVNRVDIVRNFNSVGEPLANDPVVERLVLKGLLADFEFSRLRNKNSQPFPQQGHSAIQPSYQNFEDRNQKNFAKSSNNRPEPIYINDSLNNSKVNEASPANALLMSQESQKMDSRYKNGFESFNYKMRIDQPYNR
jgi:hypothetical protein